MEDNKKHNEQQAGEKKRRSYDRRTKRFRYSTMP